MSDFDLLDLDSDSGKTGGYFGETWPDYEPPHLQELGDIRSLTLGGSGDNPESGGGFYNIIPGGAPPGSS